MLLGLGLFPAISQGQDCISVHFDKSFYVAGETIWFKPYLINDSAQIKSRVLHVDLVSHQNNIIATQKLLIGNKSSFGSIVLPVDSQEGYYRFRAYTLYNMNFDPAVIYQKSIAVYQPTKKDNLPLYQKDTASLLPVHNHEVSLVLDKSVYKPRDSLRVSLQFNSTYNTGREGNLSVSVVPLDIAKLEVFPGNDAPCNPGNLNRDQPLDLERSLYLQGRLLDPVTKSKADSRLITVYMDKFPQLIKTYANEGKLKIPVNDYWGTGVFQILNLDPYNSSEFEFIADTDREFTSPYYNFELPIRAPMIIKYMEQLEKRRKIIELFDQQKFPEIEYSQTPNMIPDAVYRTEDYKEIYSFEEFINEAIGNVKVRTINGTGTIRLFNKEMGDPFPQHPWYIVDGFMTFNEKEALDIQYQDIVEVRLYSKTSTVEKYFKHFMWNNGVFEIITRDVKYIRKLKNNPNVVQMEGFTRAQNFNSTLSPTWTTPDLRGVIYWTPNVFINKEGIGELTIPLSDDTGKFAIVVKGTANSNRLITGFSTFEIKTK